MRKPVYVICKHKGADQPAHLCSLISIFVVHSLDRVISLVPIVALLLLLLTSIAEQASLRQVFS